jgi:hypothetical protein
MKNKKLLEKLTEYIIGPIITGIVLFWLVKTICEKIAEHIQ